MRIKSFKEFNEKLDIALQLQEKIEDGTATEQNLTMFSVLNSELQEYKIKLRRVEK